jgi:uncharacterized membrane protein YfcA
MDLVHTALVAALGFSISIISASVGGTALIMVPLLVTLGIEPRVAIGTNKIAILFLSLAATMSLSRRVALPPVRVVLPLALPVVIGNLAGAMVVVRAPAGLTRLVVGAAAIVVAVVISLKRNMGLEERLADYSGREVAAAVIVLLPLSVYGGFFTGGYATLMTYTLVLTLGYSFLQGAAAMRLLSVFGAAAASIIFAKEGVIDYTLGAFLGTAYFAGAMIGARLAVRKGNRWLKTLFLIAVVLLALRILILEIIGRLAG